jgi:hypothetical protein
MSTRIVHILTPDVATENAARAVASNCATHNATYSQTVLPLLSDILTLPPAQPVSFLRIINVVRCAGVSVTSKNPPRTPGASVPRDPPQAGGYEGRQP